MHDADLDGPEPTTTVAADDGVTLAVHDTGGASDRVPLVLVHGYTAAMVNWVDVLPALAEDRRVVLFDHRGHGRSENPGRAEAYSLARLRRDTIDVADACGLDRFHLLGHSMGGAVAQLVALAHPDRLASLFLMGTSADGFGRMGVRGRSRLAATVADEGWPKAWALMQAAAPSKPLPWMSEERTALLDERRRRRFHALDPVGFVELARAIQDMDSLLTFLAGQEPLPTTLLVGDKDGGLVAATERMAAAMPCADHVVFADAAHNTHDEYPDRWLTAVRDHLAKAEASLS